MYKIRNGISFLAALLLSMLLIQPAMIQAKSKPKDIVMVVDISRSMIGFGNRGETTKNIFEDVKKKLHLFVDVLNAGDTLYLISFGTDVYDTQKFDITGVADIADIKTSVDALIAADQLTFTAKMLKRLKLFLEDLSKTSAKEVQLAVIFTDAIDDPPTGKESANVSDTLQKIDGDNPRNSDIYYFSLNPNISQKLKAVIGSYFPQVILHTVNSDDALTNLTQEAIDNLNPLIHISVPVAPYKPFEFKQFPFEITANKEAVGLTLHIDLQQGADEYLSLDQTEIVLKKGVNTLTLTSAIPIRYAGDWNATVHLKMDTVLDTNVRPENPYELTITASPLSFGDKMTGLPEYYVTALILIVGLLVGLYYLIMYLSFVPKLELYFWETADDEKTRSRSGKFKPFDLDVIKNKLDLIDYENKKYLVSGDINEQPGIHLEKMTKLETFHFLIQGANKRKKRFSVAKNDKIKISFKKNFKGKFAKNHSYFRIGAYSFAVKTNVN